MQALAEVTGLALARIDTALTVQGLGLDSLDFVRVVQLSEDTTGLRLDDAQVAEVVCLDDLILLIERTLGQGERSTGPCHAR